QRGDQIAQPGGGQNLVYANFIDDFIFDAMASDQIPHAGLCTDEEFLRRAYLDLTGRIPTTDQVRSFLDNSGPDKRTALVDALLGTPEYVDRWTMYWGDLLRNTSTLLANGRKPYNTYLRDFLLNNRPYDQFLYDLVTARGDNQTEGPANFPARAIDPMGNR